MPRCQLEQGGVDADDVRFTDVVEFMKQRETRDLALGLGIDEEALREFAPLFFSAIDLDHLGT